MIDVLRLVMVWLSGELSGATQSQPFISIRSENTDSQVGRDVGAANHPCLLTFTHQDLILSYAVCK